MTYAEAVEYIGACNGTVVRLGLERITELLELMNNPQDKLEFIHVTGTNGKGSVCAMLRSVLTVSGEKAGMFSSPSMRSINDTITVDGVEISDGDFADYAAYVKQFADRMSDYPSGFELETAMAFEYFRRNGCTVVVLEAGMGGRLDATNVIKSNLLSIITNVSLDHTKFLGDTVEKIAAEKAGIIKPSAPVIYGGGAALCAIKAVADGVGSEVVLTDYGDLSGLEYSLNGTFFNTPKYKRLYIKLLGEFQPRNALMVLDAVEILRGYGFDIGDAAVYAGLENAVHIGRFELLSKNPIFIADGAHNPLGIHSAVNSIKLYFGEKRVNIVTGVMEDKDYSACAEEICTVAAAVFTAAPDNPRALDAKRLAGIYSVNGVNAESCKSVKDAVKKAFTAARETGLPIIALGSLYMYKDLR